MSGLADSFREMWKTALTALGQLNTLVPDYWDGALDTALRVVRTALPLFAAVLLVEIALLIAAGFLPQAMNPLANALMSFACAMQVDSFRKFRGVPCATTMCIGNMRSGTEALCVYFHTHDREVLKKALTYFGVIGIFAVGAGLGSVLTARFAEKGIWVSCLLLAVSFLMMFVREEEKK